MSTRRQTAANRAEGACSSSGRETRSRSRRGPKRQRLPTLLTQSEEEDPMLQRALQESLLARHGPLLLDTDLGQEQSQRKAKLCKQSQAADLAGNNVLVECDKLVAELKAMLDRQDDFEPDAQAGPSSNVEDNDMNIPRIPLEELDAFFKNKPDVVDLTDDKDNVTTGTANVLPSADNEPEEKCCTICLDVLCGDLSVTWCGHVFHKVCIQQSFKNAKVCPICRKKLTQNKIHPVYL